MAFLLPKLWPPRSPGPGPGAENGRTRPVDAQALDATRRAPPRTARPPPASARPARSSRSRDDEAGPVWGRLFPAAAAVLGAVAELLPAPDGAAEAAGAEAAGAEAAARGGVESGLGAGAGSADGVSA